MINTEEKESLSKQEASYETPPTRVLFLLHDVTDARYQKRKTALTALGVNVEILAFERAYSVGTSKLKFVSLGKLGRASYLKRSLPFLKALPIIRNYARSHDSLYAFGLDMLLLAWIVKLTLAKPVKLIYEVADIRELLLGTSLKSKLARALESFLVKRTNLLVLTSEAYYKHFYEAILSLSVNYKVIENKLEKGFIAPHVLASPEFRLGYFGLLRCPRSWEIVNDLAKQGISVYIRGFPTPPLPFSVESLESAADKQVNLSYMGSYLAPDQLAEIYEKVELVWACYPFEGNRAVSNSKWARTNRFYEACFFKKPMICQVDTEDARVVKAFNIGIAVDLNKPDEVIKKIIAIDEDQMLIWKENLENLAEDIYMYSDEHKQLAHFLVGTNTLTLGVN